MIIFKQCLILFCVHQILVTIIPHGLCEAAEGRGNSAGHVRNYRDKIDLRVPKCCEDGYIIDESCKKDDSKFQFEIDVLDNNETHLDDTPIDLSSINVHTYHQPLNCRRFALEEEDNFALLKNGSLIVGLIGEIYSSDEFCVETIKFNGTYYEHSRILMCIPFEISKAYYFYLAFSIVSLLCLIGTDVMFLFINDKVYGIHKYCKVAYCSMTAMTFLFLVAILSSTRPTISTCKALGTLFQLAYISSHCLLAILCFDLLFMMYFYSSDMRDGRRKYVYAAITILVPLLSLICLVHDGNPAVPNSFFKGDYHSGLCTFNDKERVQSLFYIPVGVAMCVELTSLILVYVVFRSYEQNADININYQWLSEKSKYKNMFKQSIMCWVIASLCLIPHFLSFTVDPFSGAAIAGGIVELLQGVFLCITFLLYKYRDKLKIGKRKELYERNNGTAEMQMLNENHTPS